MKHLLLSGSLAAILLIILNLTILTNTSLASSSSSPHNIIEANTSFNLINSTASITFTPVATVYLPIVVRNYPPSPVITDISYSLISRNDPDCDSGDYYEILFKYTDPDGNGDTGYIRTTAVFLPSKDTFADVLFPTAVIVPSNGYSGMAIFNPCIDFTGPDTRVDITVVLVDGADFESNALTITIPKP